MTTILKSSLQGTAVALSVALFAVSANAEPLSLRISSTSPQDAMDVMAVQRFAEILEEKMGDDFEYELFHSGSLGDEVVHIQQIRSGQLDVYPLGSDAVELDSKWAIFDMPFLFDSRETIAEVVEGEIGDELAASMRESAGLEVLGFAEIGFRQITNNVRPIVTPADFQGMKIRTPGSRTRLLTFETLGATPVTMNYGEIYLALQSGTIDGQENPLSDIATLSLQEVQKYLSISNHVYTPVTIVMNGQKFDSLTEEQQTMVREAARQAGQEMREVGAQKDKELLQMMEDYEGIEINEVDLAAFQEAAQPLYDEIGEVAGSDFATKVREAVQ